MQELKKPLEVIWTPLHQKHAPPVEFYAIDGLFPHHEHPGRVKNIVEALRKLGAASDGRVIFHDDVPNYSEGEEYIRKVHDADMVDFIKVAYEKTKEANGGVDLKYGVMPEVFNIASGGTDKKKRGAMKSKSYVARMGYFCFDTYTGIVADTFEQACGAAAIAIAAVRMAVNKGNDVRVYGLCRPPGHHAGRGFFGGYCYFNNAAIAAEVLRKEFQARKVCILDVDYHHGNGTQEIYYDDEEVLYVSLHADPEFEYPTIAGSAEETKPGSCINVPLPEGTDIVAYRNALVEKALPPIREFAPEYVVISLGLDIQKDDPQGKFALLPTDFAVLGETIAQAFPKIPIITLAEGGYKVDTLGDCAVQFFQGLCNN
eukprot:Clim_evm13s153 gene=Clim_evmTU13s153